MKKFLRNITDNSKILNYLKGPDNFQKLWTDSIVCGTVSLLFNGPGDILKRISNKWQSAFSASVLVRVLRYLADRVHILTGLLLIINMIIPDNRWHNEYGVYMTITLFMVFAANVMLTPKISFDIASVDYSAILFFLSILMAAITSLFPGDSLNYLIYFFICFLAMLVIISSIESPGQLDTLLKLISFGTFLTSIYGIYQWKIAGVAVNPSQTDLAISQDLGGRVFSTMGNCNIYGELLILTIPFFIALILNEKTMLKKALWAAFLLPVIVVLFKTGSRSAWVGFAASVFVFVFFWNKRLIPIFLFIGFVALPILPSSIYNRILTIFNPNDKSVRYRMQILDSALSMLKDYWITGVGLGRKVWNVIFNRYKSFGLSNVAHTHTLLMQLWLEAGLPALTTFLLMVFRMVRNTYVATREKKNAGLANILTAALSAVAGLIVMGFADYVWFYNRILFMFWTAVAISFAALKLIRRASDTSETA